VSIFYEKKPLGEYFLEPLWRKDWAFSGGTFICIGPERKRNDFKGKKGRKKKTGKKKASRRVQLQRKREGKGRGAFVPLEEEDNVGGPCQKEKFVGQRCGGEEGKCQWGKGRALFSET